MLIKILDWASCVLKLAKFEYVFCVFLTARNPQHTERQNRSAGKKYYPTFREPEDSLSYTQI
jgi:hypothetical protein